MDLLSPKTIKQLLLKHNTKPSKHLGQSFLISKSALSKVVAAAELTPKDTILEVGPGIGTLTQELAKKAEKIVAVEKDKMMVEILKETLKNFKNVNIINSDILKINFQFSIPNFQLNHNFQLPKKYKIIANLPYYVTSPVIRMFLETENLPDYMVLMVQKEVAQRICAIPPSPPHQSSKRTYGVGARMSLLAVSVQFYAKAKIISYVSKKYFWPSPKVDSAIIKIIPRSSALISASFRDNFFKIVKAGFSSPRKQLVNNLYRVFREKSAFANGYGVTKEGINLWLLKNKIDPSRRAETLTVQDWINLSKSY